MLDDADFRALGKLPCCIAETVLEKEKE